jgi:hypothetical protein
MLVFSVAITLLKRIGLALTTLTRKKVQNYNDLLNVSIFIVRSCIYIVHASECIYLAIIIVLCFITYKLVSVYMDKIPVQSQKRNVIGTNTSQISAINSLLYNNFVFISFELTGLSVS